MATGRFKFYDKCIGNFANGTIDLDTDTFNIRLFTTPADVIATDGNIFKITPHASGIFTLTGNNTD
jgi:hypothetical protein